MRSLTLIVVFGLSLLVGCGSGSGPAGAPSTVPPGDTLGQLSASQLAALCDYLANVQGGYGQSVTCPAGDTQDTDPSQAACIQSSGTAAAVCPTLTAGEAESCAAACGKNLCAFDTEAACAPIRNCLGQAYDAGN
jgi:hypothetical protein